MNIRHISAATLGTLVLATGIAFASMTLRYYNEDSRSYTWDATCSGSKTKVSFSKSTTSSVSIQGSTPCVIHTPNGDVTFKGDAKIRIKDGKIKLD